MTYDVSTDLGKVRLLITDTDSAHQIFADAEVQAYLDLGGSVFRGAALALETIATSEVLIQKRIETLSLKTDGPAEAAQLMKLAASLRDRDNEDGAGFDIAEQVFNDFGVRERYYKQWQRGSL